jgi:hypothetical protein
MKAKSKEKYDPFLTVGQMIMENPLPPFDKDRGIPLLFAFINNSAGQVIEISHPLYAVAIRHGWTSKSADANLIRALEKARVDNDVELALTSRVSSSLKKMSWLQDELEAIIDFANGYDVKNPLVVEDFEDEYDWDYEDDDDRD